MIHYRLWIDGQFARAGTWDLNSLNRSFVVWGDGGQFGGALSMAHWSYVRFGTLPLTHPGDLDCDGLVNFADINPFVLVLIDPAGYATQYPNCPLSNGDVNGDGRVDFNDINPFVALLTGE